MQALEGIQTMKKKGIPPIEWGLLAVGIAVAAIGVLTTLGPSGVGL